MVVKDGQVVDREIAPLKSAVGAAPTRVIITTDAGDIEVNSSPSAPR